MKVMAAGKAKNAFGLLIDIARAEPVTIAKHGRAVAVVLSVEEYERLRNLAMTCQPKPEPEALKSHTANRTE